MRFAFLGTGEFGVAALRALTAAGHTPVCAVSQPDRPAGRGRAIQATPIHAVADALGIRHVQTADINAVDLAEEVGAAEVAVVAAFGQKLGPRVLGAFPHGCVNIHASLLPRYRGAAPYQWAILNGDATTGVTVFQIDERWDAGAILATRETPIGETETADELHDRLARLGAELIVEVLADIAAGRAVARPQDPSRASRARKLSKADGTVDFSQTAFRVARRINGLWSWPAAACVFRSASGKTERVQLARARAVAGAAAGAGRPGALREDGFVQAGDGAVEILEIKPAGGRLMTLAEYGRGRDLRPPAQFEAVAAP